MPPKYRSLTNRHLISAGKSVLRICKSLSPRNNKEDYIHGILWGYLEALVGPVEHEYRVKGGRIDFRKKPPHASVLELATILTGKSKRGRKYGVEGYASRNKSELKKLTSMPSGSYRRRILLILDFHNREPIESANLRSDYRRQWREIRKTRRLFYGVSVFYVHPRAQCRISLKPLP